VHGVRVGLGLERLLIGHDERAQTIHHLMEDVGGVTLHVLWRLFLHFIWRSDEHLRETFGTQEHCRERFLLGNEG
jgi:hypothetical protein